MAVACEAASALAIPSHHQPIAVMLDFVNPERAGRRLRRLRRQARLDEAGGTLQDHGFQRSSRAVQPQQCLPRSYAAIDCFGGSNGKPRTLSAGFLWLPTSRCIAWLRAVVWPWGLTFVVVWLVLTGHFVMTGVPDWRHWQRHGTPNLDDRPRTSPQHSLRLHLAADTKCLA